VPVGLDGCCPAGAVAVEWWRFLEKDCIVKLSTRGPAALLLVFVLLLGAGCASVPQTASITGGAGDPARRTAVPLTPPTATPASYPAPAGYPAPAQPPASAAPVFGYRVVNTYPHDRDAFTQGLVYVGDDTFYEGTGLEGRSSLREVSLADGAVRRSVRLGDQFFGEGVAVVGDYIFQLTWRNGVGFIYDRASFEQVGTFTLPTEGWGLTFDGQRLILSDGSDTLYFVDPEATRTSGALAITGQIAVRDAGEPVYGLNELEMVGGELLANMWQTDRIARIDPTSGQVTGWIDLSGLLSPADSSGADVLNGIAYDAAGDRLFVTGKLWPMLFEIELVGPVSLYAPMVAG